MECSIDGETFTVRKPPILKVVKKTATNKNATGPSTSTTPTTALSKSPTAPSRSRGKAPATAPFVTKRKAPSPAPSCSSGGSKMKVSQAYTSSTPVSATFNQTFTGTVNAVNISSQTINIAETPLRKAKKA